MSERDRHHPEGPPRAIVSFHYSVTTTYAQLACGHEREVSSGKVGDELRCSRCRAPGALMHSDDTAERASCPRAGQPGHRQCGVCAVHACLRIDCGCLAPRITT